MKNKISLVFLFVISINVVFCQLPFKKVISTPIFYNNNILHRTNEGNYMVYNPSLILMDSLANIISNLDWIYQGWSGTGFQYSSDNKYLITGLESVGFAQPGTMICKADTNGSVIWKNVFDSIPEVSIGTSITSSIDKNVLIAGTSFEIYPPFFGTFANIYKIDSSGNSLWHKYYLGANLEVVGMHITNDGDYILPLNIFGDGSGILKIDTAGNILWSKTYFRSSTYYFTRMTENPDGSLMLLGITNPKTTWNTPQSIFLMKVDSAGSFIWCKTYGDFFGSFYGGSYTMKRVADGGYIISAPITPLTRSGSDLMIIKTDSSGNLEWSRSHGENGTNELSIDAFPTSDGGYFVVGTTDAGIPGPGYYIIKTDSLGFAGCQEYTDTLIVNNIFTTDSAIAITDTLVPVLTFNSTIQDTILPIPPVYNGCLLNTSQSHDFTRSKSFAYPNPSSGLVKIKSSEPFTKGSYLTVYDSMGRIIIQKPIAKEEDKQIDLTGQGRGIYLIRMMEGEKVSESKIVVD